MPKSRRVPIDDALPTSALAFIVFELAFKDERDLSGLVRYRLESVLPHGLEGLRYFYTRIGRTRRIVITLVKDPVPASFVPSRTFLPFVLQLHDRETRVIAWVSRNTTFFVRYEDGILASVEVVSNSGVTHPYQAIGGSLPEQRTALDSGPSVQEPAGRDNLVWKITASALGLALAAQLAFIATTAISSRETRLESLNEQIAVLSRGAVPDLVTAEVTPDTGLQTMANKIQRSLSRRWKAGYSLEKWNLREGGALRIEGWGPDALYLLALLRTEPALAALELASRNDEKGYESFAFEGEVHDD